MKSEYQSILVGTCKHCGAERSRKTRKNVAADTARWEAHNDKG